MASMSDRAATPALRFDFFANARLLFGWGRRTEAGSVVRSLGECVSGDGARGPSSVRV